MSADVRLRSRGRHRVGGRALAVALAAALTAAAATGCSQFNRALGQQEEVVIFQPNVPNAVRMKVRAACSHVPNVKVEPLPTTHKLSDQLYSVRYEVGSASTVQLAQLTRCLSRYPSSVIQGLETNTPGGDG